MPKQVTEAPVEPAPVAAPAPTSAPDGAMSIEEMTKAAKQRARKKAEVKKKKRSWLGWFLFLIILGGLVAGGYYGRNFVVKVWPATAKLYQMMKLDVKTANQFGLEIRDLVTKSVLENGVMRLTVTGKIVNVTGQEQPLPRIGIQLVDKKGLHVYSWSTAVDAENVAPWGSVEFSSSMNQPPEDAKKVKANLIAPKKSESDLEAEPEKEAAPTH